MALEKMGHQKCQNNPGQVTIFLIGQPRHHLGWGVPLCDLESGKMRAQLMPPSIHFPRFSRFFDDRCPRDEWLDSFVFLRVSGNLLRSKLGGGFADLLRLIYEASFALENRWEAIEWAMLVVAFRITTDAVMNMLLWSFLMPFYETATTTV